MKVFKKISDWFYVRTSIWLVLLLFIFLVIFSAVIFPFLQNLMGNGKEADVLDLQFGLSHSQTFAILDVLGEQGRNLYKVTELLVDGIYPLIYTSFLIFLISLLYRRWVSLARNWYLINLFPILIMLADFSENSGIVTLINSFPDLSDSVVRFTSLANQIKWSTTAISVLLVIVGAVGLLINRVKRANA